LIGPSITQGASIRSWRRAARNVSVLQRNVSVLQRPCGALAISLSPRGARPWVRVILVLAQVLPRDNQDGNPYCRIRDCSRRPFCCLIQNVAFGRSAVGSKPLAKRASQRAVASERLAGRRSLRRSQRADAWRSFRRRSQDKIMRGLAPQVLQAPLKRAQMAVAIFSRIGRLETVEQLARGSPRLRCKPGLDLGGDRRQWIGPSASARNFRPRPSRGVRLAFSPRRLQAGQELLDRWRRLRCFRRS
jgi:hypothetical protein